MNGMLTVNPLERGRTMHYRQQFLLEAERRTRACKVLSTRRTLGEKRFWCMILPFTVDLRFRQRKEKEAEIPFGRNLRVFIQWETQGAAWRPLPWDGRAVNAKLQKSGKTSLLLRHIISCSRMYNDRSSRLLTRDDDPSTKEHARMMYSESHSPRSVNPRLSCAVE